MKTCLLTFFATLTLFTTSLQSVCEESRYYFGADYIYWKPCVDDLHYAIVGDQPIGTEDEVNYKFQFIEPDWKSGFRLYLGGDHLCDCWEISASYTYLTPCQSTQISSKLDNSVALTNIQDNVADFRGRRASTKWEMEYQTWELKIGYSLEFGCFCEQSLTPHLGIKGLVLNQSRKDKLEELNGGNNIQRTSRKSDFVGVGPVVGFDYTHHICNGTKFFTCCDGTLQIGSPDCTDRFKTTGNGSDWKFKGDDDCIFVSGAHFSLGFLHDFCICDCDFGMKIGYEFVVWSNTPGFRFYTGDDSESDTGLHSTSNVQTLGFHGLTAGLNIQF